MQCLSTTKMCVYGDEGGGIAQMRGIQDQIDIIQGTLGKAFGVIGGYLGSLLHPAEQQLLADVNEMRAERNMPPLKRDGGIFSLVKIDESLPPKP